jgi:cellobiose phosphorylase
LPADWEGFNIHYRYRKTIYHIAILRAQTGESEMKVTIDGVEQSEKAISLVDDGKEHKVELWI